MSQCFRTCINGDNGKENGNYYNGLYRDYRVYIGVIMGLYRENGKENGNCYIV